ncbi:MAG: class I SAM-dependent methyltransferase [Solirubrobacterales bacterium]
METQRIDAAGFRSQQQDRWNSAASGWNTWSRLTDAAAGHICDRLVALAGVQAGSRVLDVAAGYGEPALTAARVAGENGRVVATDLSSEMLGFGRERAAAAGVGNLEFIEADASSLDFPEATFDAAVSRWGIIFEPDGEKAAASVRRFLKPGGRFAISSWGTPDQVPLLALPMRVATQRFGFVPPPPGTPGPLSRPTPAALGGLLEGGGFSDVEVELAEATFTFESPDQYADYVVAIAAPVHAVLAESPPGTEQLLREEIVRVSSELSGGDGPVSLSNSVLLASGVA